jgi:transposase InsO family protein
VKESTRRTKRRQEHERQWALIIGLLEAGMSKQRVCREAGCCRQTVYNVLRKAKGLLPGQAPVPLRPGPLPGSGKRVSAERAELVLTYRQENPARGYHYCRHDLLRQGHSPPAAAAIGRIWRRAGLLEPLRAPRPPRQTRWAPPRPQRPGHVQIDVKYLPGKRYEYTCVDVYSRYTYARVHDQLNAWQAREFLQEALEQLPFAVDTVQTDGGAEFKAEFAELLTDLIRRRIINTPHSPWQNGVVERFHRTVAEECYLELEDELHEISTAELDWALQRYLQRHNTQRLHSSLGYRPPQELLDTVGERVYPRIARKCLTNP